MSVDVLRDLGRRRRIYSSDFSLGVVRPLAYPQHHYEETSGLESALNALHIATGGAFYETPLGAQLIRVVPSIKSIEQYAAPKKGGAFDTKKMQAMGRHVLESGLAIETLPLAPVIDDEFGSFELEKYSTGYRVSLVFEQDAEHAAQIGAVSKEIEQRMIPLRADGLHDDDAFAFDIAQSCEPRMEVGFIQRDALRGELAEVAKEDPFSFFEAAARAYEDSPGMLKTGIDTEVANPITAISETKVWFGALRLACIARKKNDAHRQIH